MNMRKRLFWPWVTGLFLGGLGAGIPSLSWASMSEDAYFSMSTGRLSYVSRAEPSVSHQMTFMTLGKPLLPALAFEMRTGFNSSAVTALDPQGFWMRSQVAGTLLPTWSKAPLRVQFPIGITYASMRQLTADDASYFITNHAGLRLNVNLNERIYWLGEWSYLHQADIRSVRYINQVQMGLFIGF